MNILIIGYGEMGHAMEHLLHPGGRISIWDPYFAGNLPDINLHQSVAQADAVVFCTPTAPLYELAREIGACLMQSCLCLSMAKALDKEGRTAPQALLQGLPEHANLAVMYGPMIAEEILTGRLSFATLSANSEEAMGAGLALYENTSLKLIPHTDMLGAALCAVLKNVYAMLFGMADELNLGSNVKGFLAVATLAEMAALMTEMGGESATPYTLAGLGDLMTTATSEDSHHHELGRLAARGERDKLSGEGVNTLKTLENQKTLDFNSYPYLDLAQSIILHDVDARQALIKTISDL